VTLSALKPHGNPLHPAGQPDPADGVTVRLRDLGGIGPVTARVSLHTGITAAAQISICEESTGQTLPVATSGANITVPRAGLATMTVTPDLTGRQPGQAGTQPDELEPVQPVHARYWLHGKGPAPAGNMPVAVHLSPGEVALDDGQPAMLRLTVACGVAPAAGAVRLQVPDEVAVTPAGSLHYDLGARGYCSFDLTVTASPGTKPGRRFLTAQIDVAGQVIEDSALLAIGQPRPLDRDLPPDQARAVRDAADTALEGELDLSLVSPAAAVRPGGTAAVEVLIRNRTDTAVHGEAQLISPYGSWAQTRPWTAGFALAAGAEETLRFDVAIPAAARSGEQWWAIVKAMYFGRVQYSEPVEITTR
jgi:hypothetical protein